MSESYKENIAKTTKNEQALSDNKEVNRRIKVTTISLIVIAIIWVFILNPLISFKKNEKLLANAGKRYFETFTSELPTGERIGDVTLQQLYEKGYITTDFYVPYKPLSKETCSVTDSWVKVKRVDGEYKYYTYLKCGVLSSMIDHTGPKISLKGEKEITINLGDKFKDPGINKIKDSSDGEIDIEKATIKGEVDTSKMGTYKISYIAFDSLKNRTEVVRTVKVVQQLTNTIKKNTDNTGYYMGYNPDNYIYFSGMLFRIVDIDGSNVRIVADQDVANVNYDGIDKWLDYYYEHIDEESKKYIVKNNYCSMTLKDTDTNTSKCSNYTKKLNVYIPSVVDVNRAQTENGNFMKPGTMSWMADKKDDNTSYLTRNIFFNDAYGKDFISIDKKYNFGVRPLLTIKGNVLITKGQGTRENPYEIGDFTRAKPSDKVNSRQSGEYLEIGGQLWRIVDVASDGSTKVIADFTLYDGITNLTIDYDYNLKNQTYNPTVKGNIGYKINNISSKYIETKYFIKHEIEVPIYKEDSLYKQEIKTEKYKTKIFAPNSYDMFSATGENNDMKSYWLINSSQNNSIKYGVSDIGTIMYDEDLENIEFGIRPMAYLDKNCIIIKGTGTAEKPYEIEK